MSNGYLGTGIRNPRGAKRYLRSKWRQSPLPPIVRRPGARFYVTTRSGKQAVFLLGPFVSHMTALAAVPRARRLIYELNPYADVALGTASRLDTVPTRFGR